ncbi:MAG TPA: hypothetical protein VGR29_12770 [Thermomicrobiales bacterium]|nr:hypothetical protein [Thermomicrobiales bacterium]
MRAITLAALAAGYVDPGEFLTMPNTVYVCPVACHREFGERLLVRDPDGAWFLWMGDGGMPELIRVPARLAGWIADHPHMVPVASPGEVPHMWFEVSSLPVTPVAPVAPVPTERAGPPPF